jgi:hypothetical protein
MGLGVGFFHGQAHSAGGCRPFRPLALFEATAREIGLVLVFARMIAAAVLT